MHANISPARKKKNFFSGTFETCPNPAKRVPGHVSQIWNVLEKNVLGNVYSLARTFFRHEKKNFFPLFFSLCEVHRVGQLIQLRYVDSVAAVLQSDHLDTIQTSAATCHYSMPLVGSACAF
jgi:hypothetical protein